VYAHPNPRSFNAAILALVRQELEQRNLDYTLSDLYAMGFHPVLSGSDFVSLKQGVVPPDMAEEQRKIAAADLLFFIYPVWWMSPPAMLKGYIDRCFSMGFAYRYTETGAEGLLRGKRAMVISTFGNFAEKYETSRLGDSIAEILHDGILGFCGIDLMKHLNFYGVPSVSDEERKRMLEETRRVTAQVLDSVTARS
jgi:NAD(P)H dehydrogenase (quinone)